MKKILILLIPFLLTGCASVTYDLDINKNLIVQEHVNMSATKEYFDNFYMNLPVTIVKEVYDNNEWMAPLKNKNYNIEFRKNNTPYPSIYASKEYKTLDEYVLDTAYKNQLFENINVYTQENLITIDANKLLPYRPDDSNGDFDIDDRAPISNLTISIKLPFVVTDNNADKIDKSTNTYIWRINEDTENKEIKLTFDKNKIYIYNMSWYISLVIIIIAIIVVLIIITKAVKKNKKNNSIN